MGIASTFEDGAIKKSSGWQFAVVGGIGTMRILLNISPSELKDTSGDLSYLPDLLALRVGDLQNETLNDTPTPLRTVR